MSEIKVEAGAIAICRICLQGSIEEQMASIWERDSNDNTICLYQKIERCGGIKILADPELPGRICRKCNAFLTLAHKFRVICKNSDNYLREFVCKSTRLYDDDEVEYLMDFVMEDDGGGGSGGGGNASATVAQVLQQAGHNIDESQTNYEEVDGYTELWENGDPDPDEFIEEDNGDSSNQAPSPSKTLGISSDGTAIIRIKSDHKLNKDRELHICEICGNAYPRKYALEAHMRRHRDERPFECEICQKSFHLNFQLTRHIRKHTGARPYSCQYCKRSFADRSTMVKHERIHRNERPYTCETCGKSFTYSSVLKVHQLTHTGEKPFNCGICGKRFSRAHHLRAHLETLLHQNDPRSKLLLTQIKREEDCTYADDYIN